MTAATMGVKRQCEGLSLEHRLSNLILISSPHSSLFLLFFHFSPGDKEFLAPLLKGNQRLIIKYSCVFYSNVMTFKDYFLALLNITNI